MTIIYALMSTLGAAPDEPQSSGGVGGAAPDKLTGR